MRARLSVSMTTRPSAALTCRTIPSTRPRRVCGASTGRPRSVIVSARTLPTPRPTPRTSTRSAVRRFGKPALPTKISGEPLIVPPKPFQRVESASVSTRIVLYLSSSGATTKRLADWMSVTVPTTLPTTPSVTSELVFHWLRSSAKEDRETSSASARNESVRAMRYLLALDDAARVPSHLVPGDEPRLHHPVVAHEDEAGQEILDRAGAVAAHRHE